MFKALLAKGDRHLIELVGARLRSMMPWITGAGAGKPSLSVSRGSHAGNGVKAAKSAKGKRQKAKR